MARTLTQVNEFVKRVRACKIHLLILGHLRKHMPALFGKDKAQRKMLEQLPDVFFQVGAGELAWAQAGERAGPLGGRVSGNACLPGL
jgi:hypothetical protein